MSSILPPESDSNKSDLPDWVISLVRAIEASEETHPRYLGDFWDGVRPLDECPESRFLAFVPKSVRG